MTGFVNFWKKGQETEVNETRKLYILETVEKMRESDEYVQESTKGVVNILDLKKNWGASLA